MSELEIEATRKAIEYVNAEAKKPSDEWTDVDMVKAHEDGFKAGVEWLKQKFMNNIINATLHPDDCEIWVNEGDLREYDDFEKVKVIILRNEL